MNQPVIVVHGGAWFIPARQQAGFIAGCRQAALAGWELLTAGGSALDAVEAAVRLLEDNPLFDAGRGSYLNQAGDVEMDAIIMDGKNLELGAVAALQRVRHPVSLARKVMERTEHSFFVGNGALQVAQELGVPLCEPETLLGKSEDPDTEDSWAPPEMRTPADTVGAVALDIAGNLAVATSTGGTPNKKAGRVGDSPLVGSGAYADNESGAASATGWGERLMRIVPSKTACDYLTQGYSAQAAAEATIRLLAARVAGYGGLILVDREGIVGLAHNTPQMSYAYILPGREVIAGVKVT
ncbi:MAG: isoaspartyl peptidase/L-asparaginase [Chloroflexota bacterium]|nr:isoaspartyl peptidase/L-asparaginase [Chloroflexota bacterium]